MGNTSAKQYIDNKPDLSTIDPLSVFDLPKDFTWEQLKGAYRNAALQTHPDKPGGNKELFDFVTSCFEKLANDYKSRKSNKSHTDLKKESNIYFDKMINTNMAHPSSILENTEPFNRRFNKAFDECRYQDENIEFGYGNMMTKSSAYREDIKIDNVFNRSNVDTSTFNDIFNQKVPVSKQVVKYKEPEPMLMAKKIQFTEIGSKRPDDYSGNTESKNLTYTDYMKAFNGERLADPNEIKQMKQFKSIKEYQKYREKKTKGELTDKEKRHIEKKKLKEEKEELERIERIQNNDIAIQKAHEKANRLLLK